MNKKLSLSLFIFRRDMRLHDNTALIAALELSYQVIPCFIFDPLQCTDKNPYLSMNAIEFMISSLQELDRMLKEKDSRLYCILGNTEKVVSKLLDELSIQAIFLNRDYTPFSKQRDHNIAEISQEKNRGFYYFDDSLLHAPEEIRKKDGSPYTIFTPYYNQSLKHKVSTSIKNSHHNYFRGDISLPLLNLNHELTIKGTIITSSNPTIKVAGGRKEGLQLLSATENLDAYEKTRNFPFINTSLLSAHNKFGTISIREAYHTIARTLGSSHPLLRQLYWRDFFTHIAFHFPDVFGQSFHKEYDTIPWQYDVEKFNRWAHGLTGFPIIDAGMRELNTTGYMHNRVRMVVASFLVKDLHLDWRLGEQYFAQKLVDYDPSVNNGNWQWAASTGCDAQPYFRIFNPWLQQKKFDPECRYIKQWIPELASFPPSIIHKWQLFPERAGKYPNPMINHAVEAKKSVSLFKKAKLI